MPQEPWKRARQLHELRQAGVKPAQDKGKGKARPPVEVVRRPLWTALLGWILLMLLLSLGAAAYFFRGLWIPRYRDVLPPGLERAVEEVAPEPQVTLDYQALESGLGIELRIFGDYLDVLNATNSWGVAWKLTDTGNGTQICNAPGLRLYVEGGRIRSYELDLQAVFAEPAWKPWLKDLKHAGISPDLTWTALTGETEMPGGVAEREIHSSNDGEYAGTEAHAVWKLKFQDGWLRYLNGGIAISDVSLEDAAQGVSFDDGSGARGHGTAAPGTSAAPGAAPEEPAPSSGRDWVK